MKINWKETTDLNEIAAAFKEGREVQCYCEPEWSKCYDNNTFNFICRYRLRVSIPPVARPWSKPEDVPLNCWLDRNGYGDRFDLITNVSPKGVFTAGCGAFVPWSELRTSKHSTDRKTWLPCTTEEPV